MNSFSEDRTILENLEADAKNVLICRQQAYPIQWCPDALGVIKIDKNTFRL